MICDNALLLLCGARLRPNLWPLRLARPRFAIRALVHHPPLSEVCLPVNQSIALHVGRALYTAVDLFLIKWNTPDKTGRLVAFGKINLSDLTLLQGHVRPNDGFSHHLAYDAASSQSTTGARVMADIEPRVAMLEANIRDMIASLARIEEKQKATATREEMGHLRGMADDRSHGFLGRGDGRDRVRSNAALFRARQTHATAQQAEAHVEFEFYETYVGLYSITTEFDSKTGEWTSRVTLGHRMADPRAPETRRSPTESQNILRRRGG